MSYFSFTNESKNVQVLFFRINFLFSQNPSEHSFPSFTFKYMEFFPFAMFQSRTMYPLVM